MNDKTIPTRPGETLDLEKLNHFLKETTGEVVEIAQFPGGFSNLTYCLKTADKEYVLRKPPFGADIKSAHDMGREFQVLSLLKPHYDKTPAPIVFSEDLEVVGSPFYVMERLNGVILRNHSAPKMNLAPELLRQIGEALIDNLVDLHALDIQKTGLDSLGKPEGYVKRQVEGWTKRYYNAETDKIAGMNMLADWLPQNYPKPQNPTFLHNDYKHDNVVLKSEDLTQIIGVLDWEMATVGDPLMDLGASLAYWSEVSDDEATRHFNMTWLSGNLTRAEVLERYALKSGRDVTDILFYYVFGLYKNAVIAQQIYARWKKGFSQDERFGNLLVIVQKLSEKAIKSLETGKI